MEMEDDGQLLRVDDELKPFGFVFREKSLESKDFRQSPSSCPLLALYMGLIEVHSKGV
jgi:hypothetical protein